MAKTKRVASKKVFCVGMSPLSGEVYAGTVREGTNMWLGEKKLVTSSFLATIIDYIMHNGGVNGDERFINIVAHGKTEYWSLTMKSRKMERPKRRSKKTSG